MTGPRVVVIGAGVVGAALADELTMRGWKPRSRAIFDWDCGNGIAARRTIAHFGTENFDSLTVWDHSALAGDFAETAAHNAFPTLRVSQTTPSFLTSSEHNILARSTLTRMSSGK